MKETPPLSLLAAALGGLAAALAATALGGCALDEDPAAGGGAADLEPGAALDDALAPSGTATLALGDTALIELPYRQVGRYQIFEDDIVLNVPPADDETAQLAVVPTNVASRWPGGVIPYTIDPSLHADLVPRIHAAIAEWHAKTPIRLVPRSGHANYVTFTRPDTSMCAANIGMHGGQQYIWLAQDRCNTARVIHEIGHAVGMWHEHSRADRDSYIAIHWDNITPEKRDNFYKISQYRCTDRNTGGAMQCPEQHITEYDLDSKMHYDSYNFSRNGHPTITRHDGGLIPQVPALSPTDAAAVWALYFPVPGPGSSTPLWRYFSGFILDHFYTIHRNDAGMAYYGFGYEGYEGRVFPAQYHGTTPIYRYFNPGIGDHFYTTSWAELGGGAYGYAYEEIAGYIFPVRYKGTVPLYRFWNGTDHFYTTGWVAGAYGYVYEGVLGYVY